MNKLIRSNFRFLSDSDPVAATGAASPTFFLFSFIHFLIRLIVSVVSPTHTRWIRWSPVDFLSSWSCPGVLLPFRWLHGAAAVSDFPAPPISMRFRRSIPHCCRSMSRLSAHSIHTCCSSLLGCTGTHSLLRPAAVSTRLTAVRPSSMRCVECGARVAHVYREFTPGNIRLTICVRIHSTAQGEGRAAEGIGVLSVTADSLNERLASPLVASARLQSACGSFADKVRAGRNKKDG